MHSYGKIFYGSYWRIPDDESEGAEEVLRKAVETEDQETELEDLIDTLCEGFSNAHAVHHDNGDWTIVFGRQITTVSEADNDFDEMALLRVMDLQRGVLSDDVRKAMHRTIEEVPYNL